MKKIILATLIAGSTYVSANDFVSGMKLGTLGVGLQTTTKTSDKLDIRLEANGFSYSTTSTKDDVTYNTKLRLATVGAIADYHPFNNGFTLSGGVYYNANELTLDATPANNVKIGNTTYTPAQLGSLNGKVEFNPISPYLGMGYTNATKYEKGWSFTTEAGVLFQGKPDVTLSATGTAVTQADLQKETSNLEDDLSSLEYYPVLTVGFTYRF